MDSQRQGASELGRAAISIAAGTSAYFAIATPGLAAPVRFENDTGYWWNFTTLDLTLPADAQMYEPSSAADGRSVYLRYFSDYYPAFSYTHSYATGPGAEVWSAGFLNRYAVALGAGDTIGSSLSGGAWNQASDFAFSFTACTIDTYYIPYEYCSDYGCYTYYLGPYYSYDCTSGERGLIPNDGSQHYVGVKLNIDGLTHYGWIGLTNSFGFIEAFAWGYETTPGTPVAAGAPTPSTLAGLALGAAAFAGRKRRD